ncbi:MAG: hypothetical protein ACJ73V_02990 [Acidimicrobiia bacterium]
MFVGVLALAGLALVACEPLKPPPESPPAEQPQICIPDRGADTRALAEAAPTEPGCTPICLPGQEPQPETKAQLADPGPTPAPACVPICLPGQEDQQKPELARAAALRCAPLLPCLPGGGGAEMTDQSWCTNFCPPGQDQQPPAASAEIARGCIPLCRLGELIRPPIPGLECPVTDPIPTK